MIYTTPTISTTVRRQLDEHDRLCEQLHAAVTDAGPWLRQLRRQLRAEVVESSVSIEGFVLPAGEAVAIVAGSATSDPRDRDRMAVAGYARALDHVGVMATDRDFRWSRQALLDLHFDACHFQRDRSPGTLRTGEIAVTGPDGTLVYQAPAADQVRNLLAETVAWLDHGDTDVHPTVRAAMAHLHIVSIHPFRDGNGRVARIVQSLVLARARRLAPEFNSIEEHLGRLTGEYYAGLQRVQGGRYQPERDATPWVRLCVGAHLEQTRRRLAQVTSAARRWDTLEKFAAKRMWPGRAVIAMEHSLVSEIDRSVYAAEAEISLATATSDIRRLVDAGLITQQGRAGSTRYTATGKLRELITE